MRKHILRLFGVAALAIGFASMPLQADTLYWTNVQGAIETSDTTNPGTPTPLLGGVAGVDSMIFSKDGSQIIFDDGLGVYTVNRNGDPSSLKQIASFTALGNSGNLQDLALSPDGTTVLVSATDIGTIYQINLANNNAVSVFQGNLTSPRGVTYDGLGNVYYVDGSTVFQYNLTTKSTNSVTLSTGTALDGITLDPSGNLFVADQTSNLWEVTPGLVATKFQCSASPCSASTGFDGIASDGNGHIDIADTILGQILQFDTATDQFSTAALATTAHIDDLAPLSGFGAPPGPTVPEPSGLALLLAAGPVVLWKFRQRAMQ